MVPSLIIYVCNNKTRKMRDNRLAFFDVLTLVVGLPGLEPGKTGPESVVLPLHHSPNFQQNHPFRF